MGTRKDIAEIAEKARKDAKRQGKKLKKRAKLTQRRAAKGYKSLDSELKASILKKAVFVAGVLIFVAVRSKIRTK